MPQEDEGGGLQPGGRALPQARHPAIPLPRRQRFDGHGPQDGQDRRSGRVRNACRRRSQDDRQRSARDRLLPGFGSCARYIARSTIDLGEDIRSLPTPVSILEAMGRNAGWCTAAAALRREPDNAPHLIYVPEVRLSVDKFLSDVKAAYDRLGWVVVVVSEGLCDKRGHSLGAAGGAVDGFVIHWPATWLLLWPDLITKELGLRAQAKAGAVGPGVEPSCVAGRSGNGRGSRPPCGAANLRRQDGFMAAIRRESSSPFGVSYFDVPLSKTANVEHFLPPEYIAPSKNDVTAAFREYAEPLIGGPLRHYAQRLW